MFNPSDYTTGVSPRPPRLRAGGEAPASADARFGRCRRLLKAQITDWRAMVDSVMVDPAYDGQVFNVAMSDVPERKTDLVAGRYELPSPTGPTTVAVKLTDMLGEEVLIAKRLD